MKIRQEESTRDRPSASTSDHQMHTYTYAHAHANTCTQIECILKTESQHEVGSEALPLKTGTSVAHPTPIQQGQKAHKQPDQRTDLTANENWKEKKKMV